MKIWTIFVLLFSSLCITSSFADDDCVNCEAGLSGVQVAKLDNIEVVSKKLKRDIWPNSLIICAPVRQNDFKELIRTLEEDHGVKLENAYDQITCDNRDILGVALNDPIGQETLEFKLRRYYIKKIKKPQLFTKILINKFEGRNALERIDMELKIVRDNPNFAGGPMEERLIALRNLYEKHIQKYPYKS